MENNFLVIMAGGVGSRFWPVSTPDQPKQFIDILGLGKTLVQSTVERFSGICKDENIYIVTNEQYKDVVNEQLPFMLEEQILLEPCMRNTAPCIAYAVNKIYSQNPDANIVVSPADHFIKDEIEFKRIIQKGLDVTLDKDVLLTIGIKPSYAATGYGYIEQVENERLTLDIFKSGGFKEKPDIEVAKKYLETGHFLWNSGIFIWSAKSCIKALKIHLPVIQDVFEELSSSYYTDLEMDKLISAYEGCENISIDYGLMEKADNVYVIPSDFGWSDVGSWKALYDLAKKDEFKNTIHSSTKYIESKGNLVNVPDGKKVIIQGADDFMIIDTGDTLLVAKIDQDQRIKEFSKQ
jgi:mannose-1-phosphate guanylyltransferase